MRRIIKDKLLIAVSVVLLISCLMARRFPEYNLSDFKTVYFLFLLFLSTKSLERSRVFSKIAWHFGGRKEFNLILATGLLSSVVTNDVALMIVVPMTVSLDVDEGEKEKLVILETIIANGFSSLTPFGNPQNVFIHFHYSLRALDIPFTIFLLPISVIVITYFMVRSRTICESSGECPKLLKPVSVDLIMFSIIIACLLDLIPDLFSIISLVYFLLFRRSILPYLDYPLILSFLAFFGFTDNISHILRFKLENPNVVFMASVSLSQVVSNVPAALILSDFTADWKSLLWGVSVGGFGTLIASMANLISYRIYRFSLRRFTLYNLVFLSIGILAYFLYTICL